jgi:hypothetical protein
MLMRRMRSVAMMMAVAITLWAAATALAAEGAAAAKAPAAKPSPANSGAAKPGKAAKAKASKKAPVKASIEGPEVRDFRGFCDSWMQKLHDRETYNTAHITWETRDGRIVGEYVAYGAESACSAREDAGKDPIGKLTYREMRYRREGATQTDALAAPGTIIEQSDVTEIFRFGKGRWQY